MKNKKKTYFWDLKTPSRLKTISPNLVFSSKGNPKLNSVPFRLVEVFLTPMLALLTSTPVGSSSDWLTGALVELLLQPMSVYKNKSSCTYKAKTKTKTKS